ncbi:hypothetical protein GCM10009827_084000 [Dactylosporangium maewongense]|uniref:Uncharacterized protein n=1 Tax=Dactylosporangium maewongense TaxID=634393 RepID=A0ABN2C195_9ACTN
MTVTLERPATEARPTPTPCPDGLPWCVDHNVDEDGYSWHRTHTEVISADRNGFLVERDIETLDVRAVLVNNDDGTPDPVIWISEQYTRPDVCLAEGMGISPARAREFAALLVQLADHLDGSVAR